MCQVFFCFHVINVLYEIHHREKQVSIALILSHRNLSLYVGQSNVKELHLEAWAFTKHTHTKGKKKENTTKTPLSQTATLEIIVFEKKTGFLY